MPAFLALTLSMFEFSPRSLRLSPGYDLSKTPLFPQIIIRLLSKGLKDNDIHGLGGFSLQCMRGFYVCVKILIGIIVSVRYWYL